MKIPGEPRLGGVTGAGGECVRGRNRCLRIRRHADQTDDSQLQSRCAGGPTEKLHDGTHSFRDSLLN